jgi:hypothetical protein
MNKVQPGNLLPGFLFYNILYFRFLMKLYNYETFTVNYETAKVNPYYFRD